MSDRVDPLNLGRFLGKELAQPKHYSEEMAWLIDQEIQKLIIEAESTAKDILTRYRLVFDTLAGSLIKEEVLEKDNIDRITKDTKARTKTGNPSP